MTAPLSPVDSVSNVKTHLTGRQFSSRFLEKLDWLGRKTLVPIQREVEHVGDLIQVLRPGQMGQSSTKTREVGRRILMGIEAVIVAPPAALIGAVGAPLAALTHWRKAEFHLRQVEPIPALAPMPTTLSVRSHNLGGIPFVSARNRLERPCRRAAAAAELAITQNSDVLCFQEVFDLSVTEDIVKKLKHAGYSYFLSDIDPPLNSHQKMEGSHLAVLNSGLLIASKYPIDKVMVQRHEATEGYEKWAHKGSVQFSVTLGLDPQGHPVEVSIINTHLQSGSSSNRTEVRSEQIKGLMALTAHYEDAHGVSKDPHHLGTILVGDLNFGPIKSHPDKLTGKLIPFGDWKEQEFNLRRALPSLFFEDSSLASANIRTNTIQLILAIQDGFYDALQTLVPGALISAEAIAQAIGRPGESPRIAYAMFEELLWQAGYPGADFELKTADTAQVFIKGYEPFEIQIAGLADILLAYHTSNTLPLIIDQFTDRLSERNDNAVIKTGPIVEILIKHELEGGKLNDLLVKEVQRQAGNVGVVADFDLQPLPSTIPGEKVLQGTSVNMDLRIEENLNHPTMSLIDHVCLGRNAEGIKPTATQIEWGSGDPTDHLAIQASFKVSPIVE